MVQKAGLHRMRIHTSDDCPSGSRETVMWVCKDHKHLIDDWCKGTFKGNAHAYALKGREIFERQWEGFAGTQK